MVHSVPDTIFVDKTILREVSQYVPETREALSGRVTTTVVTITSYLIPPFNQCANPYVRDGIRSANMKHDSARTHTWTIARRNKSLLLKKADLCSRNGDAQTS